MAVDRKEQLRGAIEDARRALAASPDNSVRRLELARRYVEGGRLEDAHSVLDPLLGEGSAQPEAMFIAARISFIRGRMEEAESFARKSIAGREDLTSAYHLLALIEDCNLDTAALDGLAALAARDDLPAGARAEAGFALGRFLERQGAFDEAFAAFRRANDAQAADQTARGFSYQPPRVEARLQMFREFFGPAALAGIETRGSNSEAPVFVIGMPRSGTTLVERILAAHSAVAGCGEREDLRDFVRRLAHRAQGKELNDFLQILEQSLSRWAREYLAAGRAGEGIARMVDKAPLNFEHLGLVELLFPAARIVVVRRDPMDICASIYRQHMRPSHPYATRLEHLGHYYRLYESQMAFWRHTLGLSFLELGYEDLVAEPEAQSRALVEFAGLEWEDACLRFHETPGEVASLSGAQVRAPLHSGSIGFWRHYEGELAALAEILDKRG